MFTDWFLAQEGQVIYCFIFLALIGGAFFLPFPEDLILITVGVLVEREVISLELAFLIAYTAIIFGDIILYGIGYRFGINLFSKRWFRNRIPPSKIKEVRARLDRNYLAAIFLGRHLFYLRTITFICCGAVKMKFTKYLLADCLAALVSAAIMITVGYYASENYEAMQHYVKQSEIVIAVIISLSLLYWYYKRRKKKALVIKTNSEPQA